MKTIALRFSDHYAPSEGTIKLHTDVLNERGYVWYGKFGNPLSQKNIDMLLDMDEKKFLLIKSGTVERYWAYFEDIKREIDDIDAIPKYYRDERYKANCWFKIVRFEKTDNRVMSRCIVSSTGSPLTNSSKYSMSPYFVIEYKGD